MKALNGKEVKAPKSWVSALGCGPSCAIPCFQVRGRAQGFQKLPLCIPPGAGILMAMGQRTAASHIPVPQPHKWHCCGEAPHVSTSRDNTGLQHLSLPEQSVHAAGWRLRKNITAK